MHKEENKDQRGGSTCLNKDGFWAIYFTSMTKNVQNDKGDSLNKIK
jgi:hypothetical protein